MTGDAPPWKDITTDDSAPRIYPDTIGGAAWIASTERVRELLQDPHAGLYRVRLVLREAADFLPRPNRRPDWFWHYSSGPSLVMSFAKIMIERKGGRRVRVVLRGRGPPSLTVNHADPISGSRRSRPRRSIGHGHDAGIG